MIVAYLDCATGISGDMTLAALIDAGVDPQKIQEAIASLGIDGVELRVQPANKSGFRTTQVFIDHPPQHAHRHLSDIRKMIEASEVITPAQKETALAIFQAIGVAEAHVHGMTLEDVHFHEVGAIDSIADIVGAAVGFSLLGVERVICSPVPTGHGKIKIAHGICTVPAPATAEILKGIPLAEVDVESELTTPTGAAIVKVMVDEFRPGLPPMMIEKIGYGAGSRTLPGRANMLRLLIGELTPEKELDEVTLLETNLDDVSGEILGYARKKLMDAGALDVYTTSIQMKKDRPGVMMSVIANPSDVDDLEGVLFQETGTLGVRRRTIHRSVRRREEFTVRTPWGDVLGKLGWRDAEAARFTPEFDSCAELAEKSGVSLLDVYRAAEAAFLFDGDSDVEESDTPEVTRDHDHSHDHSHDHDHGDGHHHDHG
ncbi:MAG: nickel pincer cofactor biosynthesis protein LarC [Planctomycetaceae bacterium]|nr:nickel pincer cofactor biosynthesis protein LarC [Planctomycetaceae bacterium]MDG2387979.1 nickel pincer cofactor biosynthesis protein LarC [Planctomycetaceae bacterium]